jgi:hypothetical protein
MSLLILTIICQGRENASTFQMTRRHSQETAPSGSEPILCSFDPPLSQACSLPDETTVFYRNGFFKNPSASNK